MGPIAVVSDSHDRLRAVREFLESIKGYDVEAILHAGDIISPFTLKAFLDSGVPVYFVYGNNDGDRELLKELAGERISEALELELGGKKIFMYHGDNKAILETAMRSGRFDVVVYGHTHRVDVRKLGKTLIVNPGALSGYLAEVATYVILDLETLGVQIEELNL